ncbi:MAG: V-type ATP synthase subunit I [Lachnospiraceae bacterium]|nr:V-type ATP synthase subunit I [Lachnospiraceae bacterium]
MAIVEMQKLSVCASKKNRKAILELLQSMGCMQITTDALDDADLQKMDTQGQSASFEKSAQMFDAALEVLDEYAPEKNAGGLFAGKEAVSRGKLHEIVHSQKKYVKKANLILKANKEISECKANILKDENQIAALQPWMGLDIPMNAKGTKSTSVLVGTLPGTWTAEQLKAAASKDLGGDAAVDAEVIFSGNDSSNVAVVCLKKDLESVENALRSEGFAKPSFSVKKTPAEAQKKLEEDIEKQNRQIEALKEEIISMADDREDLRISADYYRTRAEKYRLLGTLPQSESAFFLEGWVPKSKADDISALLSEKFGAVVEVEEPMEGEEQPTLLHNNKFSESVEGVLESYGLPTKGHVDPTFIMSIFYVVFFGMMFADGGYGLIMVVACGIVLLKYKELEDGFRKMVKLFFWCGVSTAVWGFLYGGFFGDAIDTVAKTFFGYSGSEPILKALWFEPLNNPMRLLIYCMLFGLIHLYFGLGIKGYEYLKDGDVVGFVSDILSWYLFLTGLVLILLPTELFGSIAGDSFDFSPVAKLGMLAKIMTVAGLVLILFMQERQTKNWVLRILLGAYDIYGVTGWLSDILSYSRLLALGLASGVIANVVNMMAGMFGGGVVGAVVFVLIFVVGHTLNFAINVLGAYVHTNRLQFVEFFGKFYEGGGEPFTPFKVENKYIQIKEEKAV